MAASRRGSSGARGCTPLLLNATEDTLCKGVEAVGQLEKTENEGACTSLNASFLLWLLMLSSSLEGCQASCKGKIRKLKIGRGSALGDQCRTINAESTREASRRAHRVDACGDVHDALQRFHGGRRSHSLGSIIDVDNTAGTCSSLRLHEYVIK
jgi:hypothetical protein